MNYISKCCLCGSTRKKSLNLGEMMACKGYNAHYYCLLLSSTIKQSGEDNEGILGFLPSDICKELKRSKTRICSYCKRSGAYICCSAQNCKIMFHLPCGIKNDSGHQFFGQFSSYCATHRPKQQFIEPSGTKFCLICYDTIDFMRSKVFWAPCCKKNSYFHKKCLQKLALSAGYFFRCPICNNKPIFRKAMKYLGIFIPKRDASWELEPNAFEELLYRHRECNVGICRCSWGRKYSNNGAWAIVLCGSCGSQGTHVACSSLTIGNLWYCPDCTKTPKPCTSNQALIEIKGSDCPSSSNKGQFLSMSAETPSPSQRSAISYKRNQSTNTSTVEPVMINHSDVIAVEKNEPCYKYLLADNQKVLPVKKIPTNDGNWSVQGGLNVGRSDKTDGLANIRISDVRSLNESCSAPKPTNSDNNQNSAPETRPNNYVGVNKFIIVIPITDDNNAENNLAVRDTQGNMFMLKRLINCHPIQINVAVDQNHENSRKRDEGQDSDVIVID